MALAPEPYRSACLVVIGDAVLAARGLGWQRPAPRRVLARVFGRQRSASLDQIADLMDAIHNIPSLLENWEGCDIDWLRESLKTYDEKWVQGRSGLCAAFDRAVEAATDV